MKKKELLFWGAATLFTLGSIFLAKLVLRGVVRIVEGCDSRVYSSDDLASSMVLDCEMPAPHQFFLEDMPPATSVLQ